MYMYHARWFPCHQNDETSGYGRKDGHQLWRVAANTLNKQMRRGDEGWSSSLVVGPGSYDTYLKKIGLLQNVQNSLGSGRRDNWRAFVSAVMNLRISLNAGKLSSDYTTGGLSDSAQLHIVSLFSYIHIGCWSYDWPPLWSSGQSSWLQIRRPVFDSRHYQKKKY
jgi:hypothetical protein